jgi:uncharacterized membrane protein YbhN (UPF0104 family)
MNKKSIFKKMMDVYRRNGWLSWLLRIFVTGVVILWIITRIDLKQFQQALIAPEWGPLVLLVLAAWLVLLIGALKSWLLFKAFSPIPFFTFLINFLAAISFGSFTPAAVGDFSLVALLKKENVPVHQSLSVMLVDRGITVAIYGIIFLPLTLGLLLRTDQLWWVPILFIIAAISLVIINGNPRARILGKKILAKLHITFLFDFIKTSSNMLRLHPWLIISNTFLALVRCLVGGIGVQFAFWAAGEYGPLLPIIFTSNAITLLNFLPISLSGLGIYEESAISILGQLGYNRERMLVGLVYQRFYIIVFSLLVLLISFLFQKRLRQWAAGR